MVCIIPFIFVFFPIHCINKKQTNKQIKWEEEFNDQSCFESVSMARYWVMLQGSSLNTQALLSVGSESVLTRDKAVKINFTIKYYIAMIFFSFN